MVVSVVTCVISFIITFVLSLFAATCLKQERYYKVSPNRKRSPTRHKQVNTTNTRSKSRSRSRSRERQKIENAKETNEQTRQTKSKSTNKDKTNKSQEPVHKAQLPCLTETEPVFESTHFANSKEIKTRDIKSVTGETKVLEGVEAKAKQPSTKLSLSLPPPLPDPNAKPKAKEVLPDCPLAAEKKIFLIKGGKTVARRDPRYKTLAGLETDILDSTHQSPENSTHTASKYNNTKLTTEPSNGDLVLKGT